MSFKPDSPYVSKLLNDLKQELEGFHRRIEETESIRYLEDTIQLGADEAKSGIELRIGASAELIENVKSAITTNPASVVGETRIERDGAAENLGRRERIWNRWLERLNSDIPTLYEFADSLVGNGIGVLKAAVIDYPKGPRERLEGETAAAHVERVKALKRTWGPPFAVVGVHPLSFYWRLGVNQAPVEIVEHSWKSRPDMYRNYGLGDKRDLRMRRLTDNMLDKEVAQWVRGMSGVPDMDIKPFPYGLSTSNLSLVTEYWSPDWQQVYLDRNLIWEEENPKTTYIFALGRTTSSKDADKTGFGVAEIMRHNEPAINRMLVRMAEANELLVRQRHTIELPEGSVAGTELDVEQGEQVPMTRRFRPDVAEALPAGAKVINPFQGVEGVFQSMPMLQLLLSIMGEHGVSPLFKGIPTGAMSSGYRDNSLYMMAKSQLQTIIESYQVGLTRLIRWAEAQVAEMDEPIYIDELELKPSDVRDWPADMRVKVVPMLPQNMIAEGTFWDRMWASRHVPRRMVREKGFNAEDPAALEREVLLEDVREALKPQLITDVIASVIQVQPSPQTDEMNMEEDEGNMPQNTAVSPRQGIGRPAGRELGGLSRAGQSREPPFEAASFPPS